MEICSLELKRFRSITETEKLNLSNFNILIGPNNEGKSNILQALVMILEYLTIRGHREYLFSSPRIKFTDENESEQIAKTPREFKPIRFMFRRYLVNRDYERGYSGYRWETDFPLMLQKADTDKVSEFNIKLKLDKRDKKALKEDYGIIASILKVNLRFEKEYAEIQAIDEDTNESLDNKKILKFLATHLRIRYIDTNRTSSTVKRIVQSTLEEELDSIKGTTKYKKAIKEIKSLERPFFKNLSEEISNGAKQFLPRIKKITLLPTAEPEAELESKPTIIVDDGRETEIEFKGDGVKSLLSIAIILKSIGRLKDKNTILAIEEPESHLHPKAIHDLKKTLMKLSENNQVIITTHSPLLIDNYHIGNNIIVQNSEAKPAKSIADIRKTLGVELSDNLISARLVILTEGVHDIEVLKSWLSSSKKIKKAIEDGTIIFDALEGVSKLKDKAFLYKAIGVDVYPFLDKDKDGLEAEKIARAAGLDLKVIFAGNSRQMASEIEDLVKEEVYVGHVNREYNLDLNNKNFTKRKKKWSGRIKQLCEDNGKSEQEIDIIIPKLKKFISEQVIKEGRRSLKPEYKLCIDNFQKNIERYIDGEV